MFFVGYAGSFCCILLQPHKHCQDLLWYLRSSKLALKYFSPKLSVPSPYCFVTSGKSWGDLTLCYLLLFLTKRTVKGKWCKGRNSQCVVWQHTSAGLQGWSTLGKHVLRRNCKGWNLTSSSWEGGSEPCKHIHTEQRVLNACALSFLSLTNCYPLRTVQRGIQDSLLYSSNAEKHTDSSALELVDWSPLVVGRGLWEVKERCTAPNTHSQASTGLLHLDTWWQRKMVGVVLLPFSVPPSLLHQHKGR